MEQSTGTLARGTVLAACTALLGAALACGPTASAEDAGGGDGGGAIVALRIEPADPTVTSRNGAAAPVAFQAIATRASGAEGPVSATWALDEVRLGALDGATGTFQASGVMAGTGQVTALAGGQTATTSLTVRIEDEVFGDGVAADAPDRFVGTPIEGSPESPLLLYPLAGAVVPATLKAPDVQWDGGQEGDLYRVIASVGLASVAAYAAHSGAGFRYDWVVAEPIWTALKLSSGADAVRFTVDRWSMADGQVYRSATHGVAIIEADVTGAIYYWDLSDGRILRITEAGRESFMPAPPPRPADGKRCVACHTVSRDGRLLAVEMWDGGDFSAIFDLGQDLSGDPPPTAVPPGVFAALFATFNPDASRLLVNSGNALSLVDPTTGAAVPSTGLPQAGAAHPTWSPDGTLIAYIANHNGGWAVDFTVGDVALLPVVAPDTFGAPTILRPAAGMANAWPSFSPDSQWIAFGRGVNSRGRNDALGAIYPGRLWLIHRDGGAPIDLAAANGGADQSYMPNFSPFLEGGFHWLAFYSTRDYGNAQAGTRGTGRRQIWVTAVKPDDGPGADPSHVPYWLPDQDVATHNMSAYWTLAPPVD
jgi:hypothetical protein